MPFIPTHVISSYNFKYQHQHLTFLRVTSPWQKSAASTESQDRKSSKETLDPKSYQQTTRKGSILGTKSSIQNWFEEEKCEYNASVGLKHLIWIYLACNLVKPISILGVDILSIGLPKKRWYIKNRDLKIKIIIQNNQFSHLSTKQMIKNKGSHNHG